MGKCKIQLFLPAKKKKHAILNHQTDGSCWVDVVMAMKEWGGIFDLLLLLLQANKIYVIRVGFVSDSG